MPCTTILVGKKASNDNSTMISRTDDGHYDVKKLIVVKPEDQPRIYENKIGHVVIELPDNPLRFTCSPNVDPSQGVWAATGINAANVGMTATETITSNPRVLGADPLCTMEGNSREPMGIGEEDFVTIVLPYIHSAREGVLRLGALLEQYGTYEMNGIAFNDENEIWWMETIGGHHWIARKIEDDRVVIMPNQFGMDHFDINDALGEKKENLCSADLKEFAENNHLILTKDGVISNPRNVFGSHSDMDHIYNTPRGWFMARYLLPNSYKWDGENADFTPQSDNIPWSLVPEKLVTVEDVKYLLSSHYQGTPYDPYLKADNGQKGKYRSIGISRTGVMSVCQIRSNVPQALKAVEWICFGSTTFDSLVPVFTNVDKIPSYLSEVTSDISTDNYYWNCRLLGVITDACFGSCMMLIERFEARVMSMFRKQLSDTEHNYSLNPSQAVLEDANSTICSVLKAETAETLKQVLLEASKHMKNEYYRWDN